MLSYDFHFQKETGVLRLEHRPHHSALTPQKGLPSLQKKKHGENEVINKMNNWHFT